MASKLVPERQLSFSPTLAATIGLEEALLLQVLTDFIALKEGTIRNHLKWVEINDYELLRIMPFWNLADLKRVEKSLSALGIILCQVDARDPSSHLYAMNEREAELRPAAAGKPPAPQQGQSSAIFNSSSGGGHIPEAWQPGEDWLKQCRQHNVPDEFSLSLVAEFVNYWRDRGQAKFSWGNTFYKFVLRRWREEQTRRGDKELASKMHSDWFPSETAVEILSNAGVSLEFIEDAVPEFVLYWCERGAEISAWNTKFIEHIRRQWDKYNASFGLDDTPRPIAADWQPSDACFEILQLAEIDIDYARSKVPEFLLYWRDSQQSRASWNTVFLQYIKQDWARRLNAPLEVESAYAETQSTSEESRRRIEEKLRQLTDRSWAENARRW